MPAIDNLIDALTWRKQYRCNNLFLDINSCQNSYISTNSMLSILIPTYNYNAFPLAEALVVQLRKTTITYELICIDDGSFSALNTDNQKINNLKNATFIAHHKNLGRNANRQFLAEQANYDWLLFIDSDTIPKHDHFIADYIPFFEKAHDVIFGGFAYQKNTDPKKSLRYNFGKSREEVKASKRNSMPYKVIISANFLIKKDIFMTLNKSVTTNIYGLDYLFGAMLKQNHINVFHADNEVYHLGIDENADYLRKTKRAIEALTLIKTSTEIKTHDISLLKAYEKLKKVGLRNLFSHLVKIANPLIEKNLLGSKPKLFLFDIYRLAHFITRSK
ncbi:MAG: glycosyltransferase family 2 protein [Flavobacteriaceae bacterium]|nr:glycosyltransferase family 2 protein [Flavobacteriaceae bacterium]